MPNYEVRSIDGIEPRSISHPSTIDEIRSILNRATEQNESVIPCGSGSKLQIGNPPKKIDRLLSMLNFNQIIEYVPDDLTITVQAGTKLQTIHELVSRENQFLPLDPPFASSATIGGAISAGISGPLRLRYGGIRDLVLGVRVIFSDGDEVKCGGKVVKNVAGYDLNKLFIGSFGTLGILTEISLKLFPKPEVENTVLMIFPDRQSALKMSKMIVGSELLPMFVNFFSQGVPFTQISESCLLIGFDGHPETVEWQVEEIRSLAEQNGSESVEIYDDDRQNELRLSMRSFAEAKWRDQQKSETIICRVNVQPSQLSHFLDKLDQHARFSTEVMALAANGIAYLVFSTPDLTQAVEVLNKLRRDLVDINGNLIVESAPIEVKNQIDIWGEVGKIAPIMKMIKSKLDPKKIMNPDRFVVGI